MAKPAATTPNSTAALITKLCKRSNALALRPIIAPASVMARRNLEFSEFTDGGKTDASTASFIFASFVAVAAGWVPDFLKGPSAAFAAVGPGGTSARLLHDDPHAAGSARPQRQPRLNLVFSRL